MTNKRVGIVSILFILLAFGLVIFNSQYIY